MCDYDSYYKYMFVRLNSIFDSDVIDSEKIRLVRDVVDNSLQFGRNDSSFRCVDDGEFPIPF